MHQLIFPSDETETGSRTKFTSTLCSHQGNCIPEMGEKQLEML